MNLILKKFEFKIYTRNGKFVFLQKIQKLLLFSFLFTVYVYGPHWAITLQQYLYLLDIILKEKDNLFSLNFIFLFF